MTSGFESPQSGKFEKIMNQCLTSGFESPQSGKFEKMMNQCMTSDFESPWWLHQKTLARASNQAAAATAPGSSATTLTMKS